MILTKLIQIIIDMMAMAVNFFSIFDDPFFYNQTKH